MARPRFGLVTGGTASTITTWPYPSDARPESRQARSWYAWRLLGANNRELARSAFVFRSQRQCLADAESVRAGGDRLIAVVAVDADLRQWRWRLEDDAVRVAVSPRSYLRQRECQYNLAQCLAVLAEADTWADPQPWSDLWPDDDASGTPPRAGAALNVRDAVVDLTGSEPVLRYPTLRLPPGTAEDDDVRSASRDALTRRLR